MSVSSLVIIAARTLPSLRHWYSARGERRLLAPVGVVALEEELLAVLPVVDGVGAGADRLAHLLGHAGAARHDLDERDTQRQNRIRGLGADDEGGVVGCRQTSSGSSPNT